MSKSYFPLIRFDHEDGLDIMVLEDIIDECYEVYYRRPGYAYTFAFGLPKYQNTMHETVIIAKANAINYGKVLFDD